MIRCSTAVTFSDCGWNASLRRASSTSDNKMRKRKTKQRIEISVERTGRKALKQLLELESSMQVTKSDFFLSHLALFNKGLDIISSFRLFICQCKFPIGYGTVRLQATQGDAEYFNCLQFSVTVMSKHMDIFKGATELQSKSRKKSTIRQYMIDEFLTSLGYDPQPAHGYRNLQEGCLRQMLAISCSCLLCCTWEITTLFYHRICCDWKTSVFFCIFSVTNTLISPKYLVICRG